MKTKNILKPLLLLGILSIGLVGCGQQIIPGMDNNPNNGGNHKPLNGMRQLSFGFDHSNQYKKGLRAEDNKNPGGENVVSVKDGFVIFTSGKKNATVSDIINDPTASILKVVKLVSQGASNEDQYLISDMGTKDWSGHVPSATTHLFFLANVAGKIKDGDINPFQGQSIASYLKKNMDVKPQSALDNNGVVPDGIDNSVSQATLFGEECVNFSAGSDQKPLEVSVVIVPLVARFEISKIVGEPGDGFTFNSYSINAMYMDSVVFNGRLAGTWTDDLSNGFPEKDVIYIKSAAQAKSKTDNPYINGYQYVLSDFCDGFPDNTTNSIGQANGLTYTPKTKEVWAYNMFGSYEYYRRGSLDPGKLGKAYIPMPRILLQFDNIKINNEQMENPSTRFIKIRTYKRQDNKQPIDGAEVGHIYTISEIDFSVKDLNPDPSHSNVPVNVSVSQLEWSVDNLGPVTPDQ